MLNICSIKKLIFWVSFLVLSLETVVLKTPLISYFEIQNRSQDFSFYSYLSGKIADRPTIRWLGEVIIFFCEKVVEGFYALSFWGVSGSLFFEGSPFVITDRQDVLMNGPAIPVTTFILFVITCLLPLAYLAKSWFVPLWLQLVFIIVAFGALVGWPPFLVTLFFNAMRLFVDWPKSYYLFDHIFHVHDFAAVFVVLFQIVYLKSRQAPPLLEVIAITIVSHGAYEYMGMIFGFAYAAQALNGYTMSGWKFVCWEAFKRLCITGTTVLLMAAVTYWIYFQYVGQVNSIVDVGVFGTARYITNNLTWIHSIVANLTTMISIAFIMGLIVGVLDRYLSGGQITQGEQYQLEVFIMGGIVFGYLITFAIGIFTVPYPAEMGRNFMPLSVVCVLLATRIPWLFKPNNPT